MERVVGKDDTTVGNQKSEKEGNLGKTCHPGAWNLNILPNLFQCQSRFHKSAEEFYLLEVHTVDDKVKSHVQLVQIQQEFSLVRLPNKKENKKMKVKLKTCCMNFY